jgi:hypothetical protein
VLVNGKEEKYNFHYSLNDLLLLFIWNIIKDTCQGDSGGSIFVRDYMNGKLKYISVGITSYGGMFNLFTFLL